MSALPARALPAPDQDLQRLAARSARLALLVEASSARADARRARARLLLLLLGLACPRTAVPRRPWYVPGAVVRLGPAALLRAWGSLWEEVPCVRTVRRHLAALEEVLAIVREPGARIASLRRPMRAPRYADTIHLLEDEDEARWWEKTGAEVVRRHPELRTSPEAWARRLGSWRALAHSRQLELFESPRAPFPMRGFEAPPADLEAGRAAARLVAQGLRSGAFELLGALEAVGAHVPAKAQLDALRSPARFQRAAALYALALARGDQVRDGWAWIRSALRWSAAEGYRALERVGGGRIEPPAAGGRPGDNRGGNLTLEAPTRTRVPAAGSSTGRRV